MSASPIRQSLNRPRLFEQLSEAQGLLTLVCAPAGSGKTTLIRNWVAETGLSDRTAWVRVKPREQDPQRFWADCLSGIRGVWGEPADPGTFAGLAATDDILEEFGSRVSRLEDELLLVIDDLHELQSERAIEQLKALAAAQHPFLRLVLITRQDPAIGLHRLRLTDQLLELRISDLRFRPEEAKELLGSLDLRLRPEAFEKLYARTEGWAAGLRLAQLSLKGHPNPDEFIDAFSGSTRTVADYLFSELFEVQPDKIQLLLTRTSILDEIDIELAEQLSGLPEAGALLLELEDSGALVSSLDRERTRFRYHELFGDLLRLQLRRTEPTLVQDLHRTASEWCSRHRDPVAAIRHAQSAHSWQMAARLLSDSAIPLGLAGQRQTIRSLSDEFPEYASSDPAVAAELALVEAMHHAMGSEDATQSLARAERHLANVVPERSWAARLLLETARLFNARLRGDFSQVEELGKLLDEWPEAPSLDQLISPSIDQHRFEVGLRAVALANVGQAAFWTGNNVSARRYLSSGAELSRALGWPSVETICLGHLALAEAWGSHALSREHAEAAQKVAEGASSLNTYWMAPVHTAFGVVSVQQGDLEDAEWHLTKAAELSTSLTPPMIGVLGHLGTALVHLGRNHVDRAIAELSSARRLFGRIVEPERLPVGFYVVWFEAVLSSRVGALDAADELLGAVHPAWGSTGEYLLVRAYVAAGRDRATEALGILDDVLNATAPARWPIGELEALILSARLHRDAGDVEQARVIFERGLDLATRSTVMLPLLSSDARQLAAVHPRHGTAHGALLDQLASGAVAPPKARNAPTIVEPLTEGERRVLGYLASNLSAPEIGRQLFLSTNTVKTHMRRIYAKLDVHSRSMAVSRARELGLIAAR